MLRKRRKKLVRLTTNNQVAIPSFIVEDFHLTKGAFLEVEEKGHHIIMTPKHVVDDEDFAMYQAVIQKGRRDLEKGETVDWEEVKKKLDPQKKK